MEKKRRETKFLKFHPEFNLRCMIQLIPAIKSTSFLVVPFAYLYMQDYLEEKPVVMHIVFIESAKSEYLENVYMWRVISNLSDYIAR